MGSSTSALKQMDSLLIKHAGYLDSPMSLKIQQKANAYNNKYQTQGK